MERNAEKEKRYLRERSRRYIVGCAVLACVLITGVFLFFEAKEKTEEIEKSFVINKYLQNRDYLIYGANENSPPVRFVDTDGVYKGVVVDYMSLLALELGVEIRTEPYKWEDALQNLREGKTDICDMYINDERARDYVFTDPIYNLRTGLIAMADTAFTFDDINTMCIATERGDYANYYMEKNFPDAELRYVGNVEEGIGLLIEEEVDAVIGDEPLLSYYMAQLEGEAEFRIINVALYEEPVVLAMPKDHAQLIPIMNQAIQKIKSQGSLEKIQQKWFGISTPLILVEPERKYLRIVFFGTLIAAAVIGIVSINNSSLKKLVRMRTAELEDSRNELQMIFDNIPEYILILDENQKIVNANKGILQHAGLSIGQCIGKPVSILEEKFQGKELEQAMNASFGRSGERQKFKNGRDIYELQAYPVDGKERGTLLTLRNVTLDEINRKQVLQSSKMMAIGELAAGMAHQIRNPLSIIRMHTYMLRESENLNEEDCRSLTYIDENVQKAGRIIDNVMNFWHISGNQIEHVKLRRCINSILGLYENPMKKKSIRVEVRCDEAMSFFCNEESLKHILMNLVANAVDAMDYGGSLFLSGDRKGQELVITCQDNGCGISEENMENLFNPFFTTKDPGKGTGLGLFVVYSEVEKLSGKISVESREGRGTCFTILLPNREEA